LYFGPGAASGSRATSSGFRITGSPAIAFETCHRRHKGFRTTGGIALGNRKRLNIGSEFLDALAAPTNPSVIAFVLAAIVFPSPEICGSIALNFLGSASRPGTFASAVVNSAIFLSESDSFWPVLKAGQPNG
jgi:hypothetical protein